jgi:hypothetical protein
MGLPHGGGRLRPNLAPAGIWVKVSLSVTGFNIHEYLLLCLHTYLLWTLTIDHAVAVVNFL